MRRNIIFELPPLQKYYQQLYLFVELITLGLQEKSVTWLPEKIISGELIPGDYQKVLARVSAQCEAMWIGDEQGLPGLYW